MTDTTQPGADNALDLNAITAAVMSEVLSQRGMRRYLNGDHLELDPSDLRDIVRLTVEAHRAAPAAPVAQDQAKAESDSSHVAPPFAASASQHGSNALLLTELRRWAGDDPGYAAMLIRAAVKEIEHLDEVLASRCRAQGSAPADCSGDPSCCPDNEGYGCHCSPIVPAVGGIPKQRWSKEAGMTESWASIGINPGTGPAVGGALVASDEPLWVQLGQGKIEVGQGHHGPKGERLPAILFGRNGAGAVGIETEGDRAMLPGECIAAITFENPASLDVVAEKLAELRARIWPDAAPAGALVAKAEQHPDDLAVDRFATAMKEKMAESRAKGRGGWDEVAACTDKSLADKLMEHTKKGDPVDVANFCMMLHQRNRGQIDIAIGTLCCASLDFAKRVASMWVPAAAPDDELPISRSTYGSLEECEKEHARRAVAKSSAAAPADLAKLERENKAMRKALRPFAKLAKELCENPGTDRILRGQEGVEITVAHIMAAHAAANDRASPLPIPTKGNDTDTGEQA